MPSKTKWPQIMTLGQWEENTSWVRAMHLELYLPCQLSNIHDESGSPPEHACPPQDFTWGALAVSPACPNYSPSITLQTHLSYKKPKWTWGTNSKSTSTWDSLTPPQRGERSFPELPRGSPWNSDGLFLTSYCILSLLLPVFNFSKKEWELLLCRLCTMLGLWAIVGAQWSWLWGLSFVSFGLFRRLAVCLECPSQKLSLFLYWINKCLYSQDHQSVKWIAIWHWISMQHI